MVEKMKFISITGPKSDIDRAVNLYLSKYEIHLENAMAELKSVQHLSPYIESNPYKEALNQTQIFLDRLDITPSDTHVEMSAQEALGIIDQVGKDMKILTDSYEELQEKKAEAIASLKKIEPFRELRYSIETILKFQFIRFRFGKIAKEYYEKFKKYVYQDLDTYFYRCHVDPEYIWGVYFVPTEQSHKIDAIYSSLHFERFYLPDEYTGTPEEAYLALNASIEQFSKQMIVLEQQMQDTLVESKDRIVDAAAKLKELSTNFDVRKLAACTKKDGKDIFYILCGWISKEDSQALEKETADDEKVFCITENDDGDILSSPPTKLKNPKIFKPFEMFINMYGLPAYNEFDPTIFVALTYAFIFGAMFGDVGQGLCLAIGGFALYYFKKMDLAAVIGCAGIFSTIFGFMFGSIFGFEDIIEPIWIRPIEHMTTLPFVGKLNTVFIVAIAFGMFIILLSMVFHIINGIRAKDSENIFFDTNGLAGLVFYGSAVAIIVLFMTGHQMPATFLLVILFVLPLILIALKEPLTNFIEKKKGDSSTGKVMFAVQAFFELFEMLLSYFSNTISFVRIGAFAVSHAAMMQVVLMLAGAENGGSINWIVIILGNIFVAGMEGLIVGIQVLRLEYYEIFSRFYKGTGRPFIPFQNNGNTKKRS
ncbi:MAG TPA: ATPase [Candidatus Merdenecus merdavium]|nr:ATPase [Candidatus Merdenecus merdavium]